MKRNIEMNEYNNLLFFIKKIVEWIYMLVIENNSLGVIIQIASLWSYKKRKSMV